MSDALVAAIGRVPAGAWAVAVSGGADSVALLSLVAMRWFDRRLVIVHLNHHLRGPESDADADFVRDLGRKFRLPVAVARRDAVEAAIGRVPNNPSTRYRVARLAWFAQVVREHKLAGVLTAHHADDVAETVLLRLLRGAGLSGLTGIRADVVVKPDLRIFRPLLDIRREALRDWLCDLSRPWREDSSNASHAYRRNVVRRVLTDHPSLVPPLLELAGTSRRLRDTLDAAAPRFAQSFATRYLRIAPLVARHAAVRWLIDRGVPPERATDVVCRRLIAQATDVTQSPRQHYPCRVLVRRRTGRVDVIPNAAVQSPQDHGQETDSPAEL